MFVPRSYSNGSADCGKIMLTVWINTQASFIADKTARHRLSYIYIIQSKQ